MNLKTRNLRTIATLSIVVLMLAILPVSQAYASSSGPRNPGAGDDVSGVGTESWSSPGNIISPGYPEASNFLTPGLTTHYLRGTQYGFAIPSGSTINGITVRIDRLSAGDPTPPTIRDNIVSLVKGGVITGDNKALTGTDWTSGYFGIQFYGGAADTWGTTWTPEEINNPGFGVVLSASNPNPSLPRLLLVDLMQITVDYTLPGTTTNVNCGSGTPVVAYGSSITCVATVTRLAGDNTPGGPVGWTTSGSGSFATSPCTLSGSGGTATCSVIYTPVAVGSGSHLITASYGGDANFAGSSANQTVTVNKATLTVNAAGVNKIYDGAAGATVTLSDDRVPGDELTVGYTAASFDTKDVGVNKQVDVSGIHISGGPDADNYILFNTTDATAADITAKELTVTGVTADNKVYDGSADATLNATGATLVGVVGSEDVTLTGTAMGTFDNKDAGFGKTVTVTGLNITGADTGNYTLTQPTTTADITPKELTVTGVTAYDKVYDGTTDATLDVSGAALVGVVASDDVSLDASGATGAFDTKDVGVDKTVTVADLDITGGDAGNYALTQPTTTADITKATPALSITNSPVTFNGSPQAADVEGAVPGTVSNVKYDGFAAEPTFPGAYAVTADFLPDDPDNYESLTDAPAGDFVIEGFVYYYPWISK